MGPKDLPIPVDQVQLGATFLTPWRDSVLWVLPEHELIFVLARNGEVQKKIRIARVSDVTGAWALGDKLLLALPASDRPTPGVLEVDVVAGKSLLRELPKGGHPIGVFNGSLVRYSKRNGTVAFEPYTWLGSTDR